MHILEWWNKFLWLRSWGCWFLGGGGRSKGTKGQKEEVIRLYLLLNPLGIGPGHLLAWAARGKVLARAACHKHSPRNILAHCFFTQEISAHSETGTRMKISIRRWSGSFPIEPSANVKVSWPILSVIPILHSNRQMFAVIFWRNKEKRKQHNKKIIVEWIVIEAESSKHQREIKKCYYLVTRILYMTQDNEDLSFHIDG